MCKISREGGWRCPECGGTNTSSSTYTDYCLDCDYSFSYLKLRYQIISLPRMPKM